MLRCWWWVVVEVVVAELLGCRAGGWLAAVRVLAGVVARPETGDWSQY